MLPFMQRLDQQFMGHIFRGADLFHTIQNQRYLFWLNTGELPETLQQIADDVLCHELPGVEAPGKDEEEIF